MKVAIVGFGYVGQALYSIVKEPKSVAIYDRYIKEFQNFSTISKCDLIFLTIPIPTLPKTNKQDTRELNHFFTNLKKYNNTIKNQPLIVIKSTVLYENIKPYLDDFNIVYNPEFLNQNSSFKDALNQKTIILGGRIDLSTKVEAFYKEKTFVNSNYEYMSIEEASNFKYIRNIYGAYKILFWNWVQEQTGNARKYAELYEQMPQGEMSQIGPDGKLGFGGKCFGKDLEAWHGERVHELTTFVQIYNKKLKAFKTKD